MSDLLKLGQILIPEAMSLLEKRYKILSNIALLEPIGRRALSTKVGLSERVVRAEIEFLKNHNLIDVLPAGMQITENGGEVVKNLKNLMDEVTGLSKKEDKLREILNCKKVIITKGDINKDELVKKQLGIEASNYLNSIMEDNSIIALTGGSTVKAVVDGFKSSKIKENLKIVPARGGIGRNVNLQSNTLVSRLAQKLNAKFKLLHAPDNITNETVEALMKEEEILSTVKLIRKSNIVIVGIGRADEMARRRNLSLKEVKKITENEAVGEAFGSYFNKDRKVISKRIALGMDIEDCSNKRQVIAVSGGSDKAEAILSIDFGSSSWVLITDEGAADRIIEIKKD